MNAEVKPARRTKIAIMGAGNIGTELTRLLNTFHPDAEVFVWNRADSPEIDKYVGRRIAYDQAQDGLNGHAHDNSNQPNGNSIKPYNFTEDREEALRGADIVVVTAGKTREPGQERKDLLRINCPIIDPIALDIARIAPDAMTIVVANPVDTLTQHLYETMHKQNEHISPTQVVGLSGELDRLRLRQALRFQLGVTSEQIVKADVVGEHSRGEPDKQANRKGEYIGGMVPVLSGVRIKRSDGTIATLDELLENAPDKEAKIAEIKDATNDGGGRLVKKLGTSDHVGPAAALLTMIEAIMQAKEKSVSKTINCSAYLPDENIFIGQPVNFMNKYGKVEYEVAPMVELSQAERIKFQKSKESCKKALADIPGRTAGYTIAA